MKCQRFEKLLALYVEGDLDPRNARRLEAHLGDCAVCRKFAEELKQSQAEWKAFGHWPIDPCHREAVRQAVIAEMGGRPERIEKRRRWLVPALSWQSMRTVLTIAVVAISGAYLLRGIFHRKPPSAGPVPELAIALREAPAEVGPSQTERAPAEAGTSPGKTVKWRRRAAGPSHTPRSRPLAWADSGKGAHGANGVRSPFPMPAGESPRPEPPEIRSPRLDPPPAFQQTLVQLMTDDPNVVIFWVLETSGE